MNSTESDDAAAHPEAASKTSARPAPGSGRNAAEIARVGREQLEKDLGPTALFELAKAAF